MYKIMTLFDRVRVPPEMFSMKLEEAVIGLLIDRYERKVDKDVGVVLSIQTAEVISEGVVISGDGAAYYDVKCEILSYYPEINEVIEVEVTEAVEFGAFVGLGPIEGLIHLSQITNDFLSYNRKTQSFSGKETKKSLKKSDRVYAKISTVSLKNNIRDIKVGLTMRPVGLGKMEWIEKSFNKTEDKPVKKSIVKKTKK